MECANFITERFKRFKRFKRRLNAVWADLGFYKGDSFAFRACHYKGLLRALFSS